MISLRERSLFSILSLIWFQKKLYAYAGFFLQTSCWPASVVGPVGRSRQRAPVWRENLRDFSEF
jgi:hypothetical protein